MLARRLLFGAALLSPLVLLMIASIQASAAEAPGVFAKVSASKQGELHGYSPAAGAFAVDHAEIEPNDTPAQAQALALGEAVLAALSVADEDWYLVDAGGAAWLTVSTSSRSGSAIDTVLDAYDDGGSSLIQSDDDSGLGLFSALLHLPVPASGEILVRVRHFSDVGFGDYLFGVEQGSAPPKPPVNDAILDAAPLDCAGVVDGGTVGAINDVDGPLDCVGYPLSGPDVFYQIVVPYSFQLSIVLAPDPDVDLSIYLFTDPADPAGSCVDGSDLGYLGEGETVVFVNEDEITQQAQQLYVGVDSWSSQVSGGFKLLSSCEFVVANDELSWGSMKARFNQ